MPLPVTPSIGRSIQRQTTNLLRTGQRFRRFDQIRQRHFWSTRQFSPDANGYLATGEFDIFTTPPGQVGQGFAVALTERETNWRSANRVPDNQNFDITEIGVTVWPLSTIIDATNGSDDLPTGQITNAFLQSTVIAIRYLTNVVELGLCQDFAQASGPQMGTYRPFQDHAVTPDETRVTSRYVTNGFAAPGLRRRFKIPILLQHGETFSFQYIIPRSFHTQDVYLLARMDFWATESFVERS